MLTIYFIYISLKSVQIFINYTWSNANNWPYHLMCLIIDIYLLRFVIEIHMLARRFEVLNHCLRNFSRINFDDYIHDCILIRIWRIRNSINVRIAQNTQLEQLTSAHNDLIRVSNKFNAQHGLVVSFKRL